MCAAPTCGSQSPLSPHTSVPPPFSLSLNTSAPPRFPLLFHTSVSSSFFHIIARPSPMSSSTPYYHHPSLHSLVSQSSLTPCSASTQPKSFFHLPHQPPTFLIYTSLKHFSSSTQASHISRLPLQPQTSLISHNFSPSGSIWFALALFGFLSRPMFV